MSEIDGYERNALEAAYVVLREEPASVADLLHHLRAKRYTRESLTEGRLGELLAALPGSFTCSDGRWTALGRNARSHNVAGVPIRPAPLGHQPPFVFVSGRGSVYHSTPDCTALWDGKEKAQSEGLRLWEIEELSLPQALSRVDRACSWCGG